MSVNDAVKYRNFFAVVGKVINGNYLRHIALIAEVPGVVACLVLGAYAVRAVGYARADDVRLRKARVLIVRTALLGIVLRRRVVGAILDKHIALEGCSVVAS